MTETTQMPQGIASPLSTRAEELICASRGRQVKLTQSAVHEMFRGNRAALLEVFCGGMELTLGARAHGLCAPDGVDRLFPVGDRPWDLRRSEDQQRCRELEERVNPVVLHYAPPCTKLSTIGARPPPGHPDYEEAKKLVEFAVVRIARRVASGAEGSLENPYASGAWRLSRVIEFFGNRDQLAVGRVLVSPDLCQYDLKEPGQDDVLWKKRVSIAATYRELVILEVQCSGDHSTSRSEGT